MKGKHIPALAVLCCALSLTAPVWAAPAVEGLSIRCDGDGSHDSSSGFYSRCDSFEHGLWRWLNARKAVNSVLVSP